MKRILLLVTAALMLAAAMALSGVATMAFAGNGEPWILGHLNSATHITGLAGGVDGPMLRLTNNDASAGDTALDLKVQSGEPPMTVDSSAKVKGLNADRLDGQSSEAFAAYERTVIVSPVGTNTQNGQALLDALASIKDASKSKPYLLHIEPATYDLGSRTLQMKQWVDMEGSGELNTVISSSSEVENNGTVEGADNTEIRFLTVRRIRSARGFGQDFFAAIANSSASPRLIHVTAEATGRGVGRDVGVHNGAGSSPTMTNVTAIASGGTTGIGVNNGPDSSPTMTDVTAKAPDVAHAIGVNNDTGSSPTMTDVTAMASGGSQESIGVNNDPRSSPTMTDVTATASGGGNNVGVKNFPDSSPTMTDVTAIASGGTVTNIGVQNFGANATIRQSELSGRGPNSHALRQNSGSAKVALSQLVGGVTKVTGTLRCFNNYDEDMAGVNC